MKFILVYKNAGWSNLKAISSFLWKLTEEKRAEGQTQRTSFTEERARKSQTRQVELNSQKTRNKLFVSTRDDNMEMDNTKLNFSRTKYVKAI